VGLYDEAMQARYYGEPKHAELDAARRLFAARAPRLGRCAAGRRRVALRSQPSSRGARDARSDGDGMAVMASEDAREGPRAFLEKRAPVLRGK
jgi:enoyl-CoA hydratase/carnithine racemase